MAIHENIYLKANVCTIAAQTRIMKRLEKSRRDSLRATRAWADKNGHAVAALANYNEMTKEYQTLQTRRRLAGRQARHVGLAYGFIRGRTYRQMEQTTYSSPYWPEVMVYIGVFSKEDPRVWKQKLAQWFDEGQVPLPKCQEADAINSLSKFPEAPSTILSPAAVH